jgi:hypothetical protein
MTRLAFTAKPYGMGPKGAWVFLDLPKGSPEYLGAKGRVPVVLTVGGQQFRVSAFPDGSGGHQVNFNKAMRAAAGFRPGLAVKVRLTVDSGPRTVAAPKDLKTALSKDSKANAFFESLAPSHKKAYVDWIEEAKRPETRARRVVGTVARLREGEKPA